MKHVLLAVICLVFLLPACKKTISVKKISLVGTWRAGNLVVGDSVSPVDLSAVRLNFTKNSRYYYINNIGQTEAGTFILSDSLLITTDTIVKPNKETAVHIIKSTNDTLVLRMNMDSTESLLYLIN